MIRPGPNSPLLDAGGKKVQAPEFSVQGGLIELLVGSVKKGDRIKGAGLTGRIPSLYVLYAIPNAGMAGGRMMGARHKREGGLRGMPDLHWPVARGPFIGLYLETKRKDAKARVRQREIHELLRHEGHAVVVYDTVQTGLDVVLAYEALGHNRPSVRPVQGQWPAGVGLASVLMQWRLSAQSWLDEIVTPRDLSL